jgi:O-antigen ligase
MSSNAILIICSLLGAMVALAGLFRPFLGLLVFLAIHFIQPGELIPALAPFRLELVYGALLIVILVVRKSSPATRAALLRDRILIGAVLLIGAGVVSVPFSIWPGGAADTVINVGKLVILMLLMRLMVDTESRLRNVLWCMAAISTWFAGSSLASYYQGQYYTLHYNLGDLARAQGVNSLAGDPNELAGVLLALLPLVMALLRATRNNYARIILLTCSVVSLVAMTLTGSRMVMISLVVMIIYYAFRSKRRIRAFTACAVVAGAIWIWLPPQYKQRYLTVETYAEGGQLDDSNELRLQVWKAGRFIFLKDPILGVGAGQFSIAYGQEYLAGRHGDWMNPHNLLIQVVCELGIVGLAVFSYWLWQIAKGISDVLREKGNPQVELSYQMAIACSVMFLGIFVLSFVSHTLYRPYWYLLGGLVAVNRSVALAKLSSVRKAIHDGLHRAPGGLIPQPASAPAMPKKKRSSAAEKKKHVVPRPWLAKPSSPT